METNQKQAALDRVEALVELLKTSHQQATLACAEALVELLKEAKDFTDVHSAVVAFIEQMDGALDAGTGVLGDSDIARIYAGYLDRRGKDLRIGMWLLKAADLESQ